MANLESEIKDLKEINNELVQKVQYWKMTAAQKDDEKLALMKEINELRLKLSRLRNSGGVQAQKLDVALQSSSEKALAHLVRASGEIAHIMDLAKVYMRDRQELDTASPRWSDISGSGRRSERVHRVPPLIIGGQSIQPVVALSRTLLNTSNMSSSSTRSPNQSRNVSERAVPMHMLQDVYIPLTRIDVAELRAPAAAPARADVHLGLEDSSERASDESERLSEDDEFEVSRRLDAVSEDMEPEDELGTPPRTENPLEGPSWLLDPVSNVRAALEPDSTTGLGEAADDAAVVVPQQAERAPADACMFSPTVRRRKRASSPRDYSPRAARSTGRVLKVMVAKMSLHGSPPGAPSPRGATHHMLLDDLQRIEEHGSGEPAAAPRDPRPRRRSNKTPNTRDSSGDSRDTPTDTRHTRKQNSRDSSGDTVDPPTGDKLNARSVGKQESRESPGDTGDTGRSVRDRKQDARSPNGDTQNVRNRKGRKKKLDRDSPHTEDNDHKQRKLDTPPRTTRSRNSDRRSRTASPAPPPSHGRAGGRGATEGENKDQQTSNRQNSASRKPTANDECRIDAESDSDSDPRSGAFRGWPGADPSPGRSAGSLGHAAGSLGHSTASLGHADGPDSDGSSTDGRTRRPRKMKCYKEKPLNVKMRR